MNRHTIISYLLYQYRAARVPAPHNKDAFNCSWDCSCVCSAFVWALSFYWFLATPAANHAFAQPALLDGWRCMYARAHSASVQPSVLALRANFARVISPTCLGGLAFQSMLSDTETAALVEDVVDVCVAVLRSDRDSTWDASGRSVPKEIPLPFIVLGTYGCCVFGPWSPCNIAVDNWAAPCHGCPLLDAPAGGISIFIGVDVYIDLL